MERFDVPESVLGPRDVVIAEGPDALTYLHSQISQDIRPLQVGDSAWTFVLEPNGKVAGLARVTRAGDERYELDTDAGFGAGLLARIDRFKIRVKVATAVEPACEGDGVERDEAARIAFGWPAMGREIVPGESIPAALGISRIAVNFTKGCYPGQELVERMDSRAAEAPKSLRRVTVPDGTQPGAPVLEDGEQVGEVTSVAGTSALAMIRRTSHLGEVISF
jgi:tRNA-modifying protein YgfZ